MIPRACNVPNDALLQAYAGRPDTYTDCFEVMHPGHADLEGFLNAFYTTWLFRLERLVLRVALRRPIRDAQIGALARGEAEAFAAWTVEDRAPGQLLLCDLSGATRSYFAVAPKEGGATRLLFGSAVVGEAGGLSTGMKAALPLHRVYSRALLRLAEWKLRRG